MDIHSIIVKPLVTEKGSFQNDVLNAYSFEVRREAKKFQIKQAVEKLYDVKVTAVRTANRRGKPRRHGRKMGKTAAWKKAVVVLHPDHHIDLF